MKKLLVSDYDNTLYKDDQSIKENIKRIEEFRRLGNLFVVATGRTYEDFLKKVILYDIKYDYLILSQGSVILNKDNEVVKYYILDSSIVRKIIEDVKDYSTVKSIDVSNLNNRGVEITNEEVITKISIVLSDLSEAQTIKEKLNSKYQGIRVYILTNKTHCIEIISKETSKREGIKFIAGIEKIDHENIFVIGDANNDLEMIKEFSGYGVTNSEEIIKPYVKKIYPNVYNLIDDILNRG